MEKYNKYIVILVVVIVIGMSIGYSALNKVLSITGEVNYRPQSDVRITSFTTNNKPNEMTIQYLDFSKHQVKLGYTTTAPCTITYTVEVKNYSGVSMGLVNVNGQDSNVGMQDDIIGKMIVDSADVKTFTITFKSTQAETKTYLLTFEFVKTYTVTYSDLGNTDSYIKRVFEGGKLEQNLGAGADVCSVTKGGRTISNYTFSDGTIIIPKVTGDVVINGFVLIEEQSTTPNPPELNGDMIPVYYEATSTTEGQWKKADVTNQNNSWYDYTNQKWANAVTVVASGEQTRSYYKNASVGTVIPMDDINTMWVWIPRYSYTIKSENGTEYLGKRTSCTMPSQSLPGEIDVKFISKETTSEKGKAQYTGDTASGWRTNEAFDFPETDREGNNTPTKRGGIWVAKFETTGSASYCTNTSCDVSNVTVKPGIASISSKRVSNFFFMSRSMQLNNASTYGFNKDSGDLHMMKNDEWGAVAYLSQSRYGKYGNSEYNWAKKDVYINNDSNGITGHSGGSSSASGSSSAKKYEYNDMTNLGEGQGQVGPGASTTGNIYGIYDMSGGTYEYVMGVIEYDEQGVNTHNGKIATSLSGFKGLDENGSEVGSYDLPNEKYYNKYKSADPTSTSWTTAKPESACNGNICYGHALSETYGASSGTKGWYNDYAYFANCSDPWFIRGGDSGCLSSSGIFAVEGRYGDTGRLSCRLTFVP